MRHFAQLIDETLSMGMVLAGVYFLWGFHTFAEVLFALGILCVLSAGSREQAYRRLGR